MLDPLGRYLEPNYVVNDELSISGVVLAGEDPRVADIKAALALERPDKRAAALGGIGVRFVARERDAIGAGVSPYDAEVAGTVVYADTTLQVTEITVGVSSRRASTDSKALMGLAWGGFLGSLLWGLVRLGRQVFSGLDNRKATPARVPR